MSSPSYHSLDNPWPAEHDERYTKMDFKTPGFKPKLQHLDQSQFLNIDGDVGNMKFTPPENMKSIDSKPGYDGDGTNFFVNPSWQKGWDGFRTNWKPGDTESSIEKMWSGTSLYQDSEQENRIDANDNNFPGQPNYKRFTQAPQTQTNGGGFVGRYDGSIATYWDSQKASLFNPTWNTGTARTDQWWGQGENLSWIPLTGDDTQMKQHKLYTVCN